MNSRTLLTSFAALAAALAGAQSVPKVQIGLLADGGVPFKQRGGIHRVDLRTGKYLGQFGDGSVTNPTAVAVQPATGIAFVADATGIRRFNVSTGAYLGLFATFGPGKLAGSVTAMRFAPSGDLYTVSLASKIGGYRVGHLSGLTGAMIAQSPEQPCTLKTRISIGFRPGGKIEVFNELNGHTFADTFPASLSARQASPLINVADHAVFRTSDDAFVRLSKFGILGGFGEFGLGTVVDSFVNGTSRGTFAEGPGGQTFLLRHFSAPGSSGGPALNDVDEIMRLDTADFPVLAGSRLLPSFTHNPLVDFAIYAK